MYLTKLRRCQAFELARFNHGKEPLFNRFSGPTGTGRIIPCRKELFKPGDVLMKLCLRMLDNIIMISPSMWRIACSAGQYRLMMVDRRHSVLNAPSRQPFAHSRSIENLPLLHHGQDERLGHSVTSTSGTTPRFPSVGAFDSFSLPCADQTTHVSPLLFFFHEGWLQSQKISMAFD
ncbi:MULTISPECIES: hypothetical protein [unclassified Pseudomonas]|uniref:hypothetical protein n=1 Tax=Pseudomonas TaxID=286 RepID=UPI001304ADAC|nr:MULTISPECIES: hypothetical protein [unclassified Pseudomonas]